MKTTMIKFFAALIAISAFSSISFAQNAKRIDFAKEGCCLVWEERVAANSSKSFVFHARKNQKLTLSFIDDTKQGSMDLGKVSVEPNADPLEMVIEVTKDYTLTVSNNNSKTTSFRISVSLEDVKSTSVSDSDGERVKFNVDENSASLTRDIPANGSIDFIVNAKKGQKLGIQMGYESKASDIKGFLSEPGLQDVSLSLGPETRKEFVVKKAGDHRLTVANNTGKKITFTLYVDIY